MYSIVTTESSSSTQTENIINVDDEKQSEDLDLRINERDDEFMTTYFEDNSSSEKDDKDNDSESE